MRSRRPGFDEERELVKVDASVEPAHFASLLDHVDPSGDPTTLDILLSLFRDAAPEDIMLALIHTVERFPTPVYVERLLTNQDRLAQVAPQWAAILFLRVLNSAEDVEQLISLLKRGNSTLGLRHTKNLFPELEEQIDALLVRFDAG